MHTAALVDHKTVVGNEEKRETIANGHRLCDSIHVNILETSIEEASEWLIEGIWSEKQAEGGKFLFKRQPGRATVLGCSMS